MNAATLPPGVNPSPSMRAAAGIGGTASIDAKRLAAEVRVIWADPAAQGLTFLRERFRSKRPDGPALRAYTVDGRGRIVRAFLLNERDEQAYREYERKGCRTCPIEGVDPRTIRPAVPALPAYAAIVREAGR